MKRYPLFAFSGDTLDDALAAWHALSGMIDHLTGQDKPGQVQGPTAAEMIAAHRAAVKANGAGPSFGIDDSQVHVVKADAYRPTPDHPPEPPKPSFVPSVEAYSGDPLTWSFTQRQVDEAAKYDTVLASMRTRGRKKPEIQAEYNKRVAAVLLDFTYRSDLSWEDQIAALSGKAPAQGDIFKGEVGDLEPASPKPGLALKDMPVETLNEALAKASETNTPTRPPGLPSFLTANPTPPAIEAEVAAEAAVEQEPEEDELVTIAQLLDQARAYANSLPDGNQFTWWSSMVQAGGGSPSTLTVEFMKDALANPRQYLS